MQLERVVKFGPMLTLAEGMIPDKVYEDTYESLIGAVHVDQGFEAAVAFIAHTMRRGAAGGGVPPRGQLQGGAPAVRAACRRGRAQVHERAAWRRAAQHVHVRGRGGARPRATPQAGRGVGGARGAVHHRLRRVCCRALLTRREGGGRGVGGGADKHPRTHVAAIFVCEFNVRW